MSAPSPPRQSSEGVNLVYIKPSCSPQCLAHSRCSERDALPGGCLCRPHAQGSGGRSCKQVGEGKGGVARRLSSHPSHSEASKASGLCRPCMTQTPVRLLCPGPSIKDTLSLSSPAYPSLGSTSITLTLNLPLLWEWRQSPPHPGHGQSPDSYVHCGPHGMGSNPNSWLHWGTLSKQVPFWASVSPSARWVPSFPASPNLQAAIAQFNPTSIY